MRKKHLAMWMVIGLIMGMAGCTTYYQVSDPATGRNYYTTKVKKHSGTGAATFEDARTKSTVTIPSSAVKEISEEEFQAGVHASTMAPAETPAQPAAPR